MPDLVALGPEGRISTAIRVPVFDVRGLVRGLVDAWVTPAVRRVVGAAGDAIGGAIGQPIVDLALAASVSDAERRIAGLERRSGPLAGVALASVVVRWAAPGARQPSPAEAFAGATAYLEPFEEWWAAHAGNVDEGLRSQIDSALYSVKWNLSRLADAAESVSGPPRIGSPLHAVRVLQRVLTTVQIGLAAVSALLFMNEAKGPKNRSNPAVAEFLVERFVERTDAFSRFVARELGPS